MKRHDKNIVALRSKNRVAKKHVHKKRHGFHDPAQTTGRDNPKGGPSPALARANSVRAAEEARQWRLNEAHYDSERRMAIEFGMRLVEEMKRH